MKKTFFGQYQFTIVVVFFQVVFIGLFGLFADYGKDALPGGAESKDYINSKYPLFQDVHVMIFIGFGFLMTFLRRYGFSAISVNLLLAAFTIEWGILIRGFLSHEFQEHGRFPISLDSLLTGDFSAAVILITMGALLGKLSPTQYILVAFLETPAALVTEHYIIHTLKINDCGGSIIVHTFGAYFGLSLSRVLRKKYWKNTERANSIYHSDIFTMVGSVFLWIYFPSFNAVIAEPEDARHRAMMNTYLSLIACTLVTFLVSQIVNKHKRFDMVHIANSTLAGGVAIGTTANVILSPFHALILGTVAGILSVLGYEYITPFLDEKFNIQDTCGVNNLHGMPGVLAALASVVLLFVYDPSQYGSSLNTIYPAFQSESNPDGRTASGQALYQLAGLGLALLISIVTGAVSGAILRLPIWDQVREQDLYAENEYFHVPEDYDFITDITTKVDHVELAEHEGQKA